MKFVTLEGSGLSSISISAEGIVVFTPWWNSIWAFIVYLLLIISAFTIILEYKNQTNQNSQRIGKGKI